MPEETVELAPLQDESQVDMPGGHESDGSATLEFGPPWGTHRAEPDDLAEAAASQPEPVADGETIESQADDDDGSEGSEEDIEETKEGEHISQAAKHHETPAS